MRGLLQRKAGHRHEEPPSKRRGWFTRPPLFTVLLVVGVVFLAAVAGAGVASAFLGKQSDDESAVETGIVAPGEDSAEAGFARDMMVHHAQAVQMAEIVRDKTESQEIRALAADIALTQQAQIGQMQGWLQVWGLPATGYKPAMSWMGHPTEDRMPGMASRGYRQPSESLSRRG